MDDAVWVPTVFSKNRDRLIEHDAVVALFNEVLTQADQEGWLSGEHFSVDGTLIQAWADHKSFVRKDDDDDQGRTRLRGSSSRLDTDLCGILYHVRLESDRMRRQRRYWTAVL